MVGPLTAVRLEYESLLNLALDCFAVCRMFLFGLDLVLLLPFTVSVTFDHVGTSSEVASSLSLSLGPSGHEQGSLSHVRPHDDLAHVIDRKVLSSPGSNKDALDTFLGEAMVGDRFHRLVRSVSLTGSSTHLGVAGMPVTIVCIMMMMLIMATSMWKEVYNHKDPARLKTLDEPLGCEPWIVEMVKAQAHAG